MRIWEENINIFRCKWTFVANSMFSTEVVLDEEESTSRKMEGKARNYEVYFLQYWMMMTRWLVFMASFSVCRRRCWSRSQVLDVSRHLQWGRRFIEMLPKNRIQMARSSVAEFSYVEWSTLEDERSMEVVQEETTNWWCRRKMRRAVVVSSKNLTVVTNFRSVRVLW